MAKRFNSGGDVKLAANFQKYVETRGMEEARRCIRAVNPYETQQLQHGIYVAIKLLSAAGYKISHQKESRNDLVQFLTRGEKDVLDG